MFFFPLIIADSALVGEKYLGGLKTLWKCVSL